MTLEGELIRKCLSRNETQCSFLEHRGYKVIYIYIPLYRLFTEDMPHFTSLLEWI